MSKVGNPPGEVENGRPKRGASWWLEIQPKSKSDFSEVQKHTKRQPCKIGVNGIRPKPVVGSHVCDSMYGCEQLPADLQGRFHVLCGTLPLYNQSPSTACLKCVYGGKSTDTETKRIYTSADQHWNPHLCRFSEIRILLGQSTFP